MAMHGTGAGAGAGDSHGGGGGYEDAKQGQHESEGASGNNSLSLFQSCHGGLESAADAHEIYFMGIIDILQLYNAGKKAESFYKGMFTDKYVRTASWPIPKMLLHRFSPNEKIAALLYWRDYHSNSSYIVMRYALLIHTHSYVILFSLRCALCCTMCCAGAR